MNAPAKLTSGRWITTVLIIATFCMLAVKGAVKPEDFTNVALVVVTFYFSQGQHRDTNGKA